jgi:antitoxin (DNA-binding transcriptional repressor) of toxin-antitoxin stability system
MKIAISEARRRLPELVQKVRKDSSLRFKISVNNEVVAELRSAEPELEPGAAAKKLLELIRRRPRPQKGRKVAVSSRLKKHLYGREGSVR